MTTATTASSIFTEATARVSELSENLAEKVKESGLAYLDAYEKALQGLLDFEKAAAKGSQLSWVSSLVNTQADVILDVNNTYLQLVRDALK